MYVHFPWCRKLCPYCDFAVETGEPPHARYADAILAELAARAPAFPGERISIYFGGGTPSLWQVDCIAAAIARVRARFGADRATLEVTLECNPTDCTPAQLAAWRAAGVTRVSIGVQSLAADELHVLGRDHRFGDGHAPRSPPRSPPSFAVSADFILGTPTGVAAPAAPPWIAPITQTAIGHLSVYELTIEDRTAFGHRARAGTLIPRADDELTALYVATHDALAAAGFEHYEISSYARAGQRAVHNSLYWRGAAYLGLGVGAASLQLATDGAGTRATNPRRVADYLAAPGTAAAEVVEVPAAEMADRSRLARHAHARRRRRVRSSARCHGVASRRRPRRTLGRPDLPDTPRLSVRGSDRRAHRAKRRVTTRL